MTPVAATRAFRVSKSQAGGAIEQDHPKRPKFRQLRLKAVFRRNSRFSAGTSSISAPARSMSDAISDRLGTGVGRIASSPEVAVHQQLYVPPCRSERFDPQAGRGIALRIHVDQQDRQPGDGKAAARLTAVVVLPTPPFWFATARTSGLGDDGPRDQTATSRQERASQGRSL